MEEKLARITSASFEIKEKGILNFLVHVEYDDWGCQGIGGICLDEYDKEKDIRVGTAYGCEMIRQLLLTLDVNDLSEAKGKIIKVLGTGDGLSFKPVGIKRLGFDGGNEFVFDDVKKMFDV